MEADSIHLRKAKTSRKHPAFLAALLKQPEVLQRALGNTDVYIRLYNAESADDCNDILLVMFLTMEERVALNRTVPLGEGDPYPAPIMEPVDVVREVTKYTSLDLEMQTPSGSAVLR